MEINKQPQLPEEVPSFTSFDLLPEIHDAISKLGFSAPTPVQVSTFKQIMRKEDLIVMAQTGTGKTAAFGIPLAQMLEPKQKDVQALALAPTRELALQVSRELNSIGQGRGIRCVPVYGGASFTKQVSEVGDGAQIVAGTPGRVLDHIRRGTISFDTLSVLIIDEADEMLSMGFEKEISEILESLPSKRQNLLFSATIPDDIRRLTSRYMGEATIISVSGDEIGAKEVSHFVYLISGQGRPRDILRVLETERPDSALIFCNTRDETQLVAKTLQKAGYNADWLNSDLSQNDRERVLNRTRSGKIRYLVATDVAARGIDVSHLSHVINYSFPESLETYVHRTGRTGRMGRTGVAISLITPQDIGNLYYLRLTYKIYPLEKTLENDATVARALELDKLDVLRKAFSRPSSGEYPGLARRLMQDVHGERILGGLLAHFFEETAGAVTEIEPREPKEPTQIRAPKKTQHTKWKSEPKSQPPLPEASLKEEHVLRPPSPLSEEKIATQSTSTDNNSEKAPTQPVSTGENTYNKSTSPSSEKNAVAETAPSSIPEENGGVGADESEIYIDVGRKDGLRISHLMKEIVRLTGLPRSALGKVRMLTRSTFVAVSESHFNAVLDAIGKIEIEGRRLIAEPALKS